MRLEAKGSWPAEQRRDRCLGWEGPWAHGGLGHFMSSEQSEMKAPEPVVARTLQFSRFSRGAFGRQLSWFSMSQAQVRQGPSCQGASGVISVMPAQCCRCGWGGLEPLALELSLGLLVGLPRWRSPERALWYVEAAGSPAGRDPRTLLHRFSEAPGF